MSSETLSSTFIVQRPFDDPTTSDTVIRSSDGVDFHVYKGVLLIASPIFRDMVTLPAQPSSSVGKNDTDFTKDGLPIVTMYESSAPVVDALLRILYPGDDPIIKGVDTVSGVLFAARKYEMTYVLDTMERFFLELVKDQDQGTNAMQVYILASGYGLARAARISAFETLKYPLGKLHSPRPRLDGASLDGICRLLDYREAVVDSIASLFGETMHERHPNFFKTVRSINLCKNNCARDKKFGCGSWIWLKWRSLILENVHRAPLAPNVIDRTVLEDLISRSRCSTCPGFILAALARIVNAFKEEMIRLVSEVRRGYPLCRFNRMTIPSAD